MCKAWVPRFGRISWELGAGSPQRGPKCKHENWPPHDVYWPKNKWKPPDDIMTISIIESTTPPFKGRIRTVYCCLVLILNYNKAGVLINHYVIFDSDALFPFLSLPIWRRMRAVSVRTPARVQCMTPLELKPVSWLHLRYDRSINCVTVFFNLDRQLKKY